MSEHESRNRHTPEQPAAAHAAGRELPPAARRALAEAEARRTAAGTPDPGGPRELNGRDGPDPVRYGDWEVKGIASDF